MKRFAVLVALALWFAFTYPTFVVSQAPGSGATLYPDHITLTWAGDPATTMTITWRTDATVTSGLVKYQADTKLSAGAKQTKASSRDFISDLGMTRLFTASLTGLCSNTRYSYRVGDGEHWSDTLTFSTADPETRAFKFIIFGDSQSPVISDSPYANWRTTAQNAYKANPDAKFMVNLGDLVDFGQRGAHWNAWFNGAAGVIDSIPIMPVVGNHEYYGLPASMEPSYYTTQFSLPQNGPENLKNRVYSFDYGPVHFVVLDSQQYEARQSGDILAPQQAWLDADLNASEATWKIVFFHKPPYEIKLMRANPEVKAAFCPILDRHHVDLVFNAHDHGLSRTYALKNDTFAAKPSQGTIYYIVGRSGDKTYSDLEKKVWNTFFYNPQEQPNYLVVEVADEKITVKTILQDGTLVDTFFIDKAKDVDSDTLRNLEPATTVGQLEDPSLLIRN